VSATTDQRPHYPVERCLAGTLAAPAVRKPADLIALYASRPFLHPATEVWQKRQTAPEPIAFGRAVRTPHPIADTPAPAPVLEEAPVLPNPVSRARRSFRVKGLVLNPLLGLRRLVTAGFVVTLLLTATAGTGSAQQRYLVRDGDTLSSVAAEFGVDPDAILRASWVQVPGELTPGDVIVIPDPGQSPDEAAAIAAENEGTSPWVSDVYYVTDGDTIESVAANFGVSAAEIADLNGLENPDLLNIGQRLLIPGSEPVAGDETYNLDGSGVPGWFVNEIPGANADDAIPGAEFPWVPTHQQQRNLSCEYASVYIATSAFGQGVPEEAFYDTVPLADNPHRGYRGNIDGAWGNYDDYGIYPEPLVPVLEDWGFTGEVFYSDGDPTYLKQLIDGGVPVITWLATWGDTGKVYTDDGTYTVFAGEHVVVAYAYDDYGVYVSDPAHSRYRRIEWSWFLEQWGANDGMSLAVYPSA
jgi:LysM repeat protein/uncharacterized protein YvpB